MVQTKDNRAIPPPTATNWRAKPELIILLITAAIYLAGLLTPPHLMDDVDAAEALQAKNMLLSGDWVTQRLNGTLYLDKAPLKYWVTAGLYSAFGTYDWVARLPTVLSVMALCWLVVRMVRWTDSSQAALYSGLVLSTSLGLFLFTRTIIPDVILTLFIAWSLWCFFRLLESDQPSPFWAMGLYAGLACAVLTKGLVGLALPLIIVFVYLLCTGKLLQADTMRRLYPGRGILLFLAIAAPWHVIATLHNPPLIDVSLKTAAGFGGKFRGFFWFYFMNEQLLRFLNRRWPRDYNTVPRLWFYCYHLLWFFPWSFFLPAVKCLNFRPADRASRLRLLAVCWIAVVMIFFTFSTTQEYYSMPVYPAVAMLLGSAMAATDRWLVPACRAAGLVAIAAGVCMLIILTKVWPLPAAGDIYSALSQHPDFYTLSLGHMADLTMPAFAYLRLPLGVASAAFLGGGLVILRVKRERAYFAIAFMLVCFFQAARLALIVFDPYLSSYAVAQKLNQLPRGTVMICGKYNPLSSVFFYSHDQALQNDPDLDILEYGTLAPGARKISITDAEMKSLWNGKSRVYLVAKAPKLRHVEDVLGSQQSRLLLHSGDKYLFANAAFASPPVATTLRPGYEQTSACEKNNTCREKIGMP